MTGCADVVFGGVGWASTQSRYNGIGGDLSTIKRAKNDKWAKLHELMVLIGKKVKVYLHIVSTKIIKFWMLKSAHPGQKR